MNPNTTKIINLNKNKDINREMENLTNLVELEGGSVEFYDDLLK